MNCFEKLNHVLYSRLSKKLVSYLKPYLRKEDQILDIGSGNGYVANQIIQEIGCKITCVDIIDINKVGPAPIIYDGLILPFTDKSFTTSLILFCLHHTNNKRELLQEAIRVTQSKIIIMEDFAENYYDYALNTWHRVVSLVKFHCGYVKYLNHVELLKIFDELSLTVDMIVKIPPRTNPTHPTRKIMCVLSLD